MNTHELDFRKESKKSWCVTGQPEGAVLTDDRLKLGAILRIADALDSVAESLELVTASQRILEKQKRSAEKNEREAWKYRSNDWERADAITKRCRRERDGARKASRGLRARLAKAEAKIKALTALKQEPTP